MTKAEARENINKALRVWVEALGLDPSNFDYSYINQDLDDIEAYLEAA